MIRIVRLDLISKEHSYSYHLRTNDDIPGTLGDMNKTSVYAWDWKALPPIADLTLVIPWISDVSKKHSGKSGEYGKGKSALSAEEHR